MPSENLSSTAITNIDASPPVRSTAGKGGGGKNQSNYGAVTPTNGKTTGSVYRMVRVPSRAVVKHVRVDYKGTITTLTGDITVYYSDEALDQVGISFGKTGVVNSLSTTASLFAHDHAFGSDTAGAIVEVTDANSAYGPLARNKELWDACGLTSDPGGFFDIVIVTSATNNVSAADVGLEVVYVDPLA